MNSHVLSLSGLSAADLDTATGIITASGLAVPSRNFLIGNGTLGRIWMDPGNGSVSIGFPDGGGSGAGAVPLIVYGDSGASTHLFAVNSNDLGDNVFTVDTIGNVGFSGNFRTPGSVGLGGAGESANVLLTLQNGHIKSSGSSPSINATSAAGTGASASVTNATDNAGYMSLTTTAVAPSSGALVTLVFAKMYNIPPVITITPANDNAALLASTLGFYVSSTVINFSINSAIPDTTGATYAWYYTVIETP